MAELDDGYLFGECKWRAESSVDINDYVSLRAKLDALPNARWKMKPRFILFAVGGFTSELRDIANNPSHNLVLISGTDLIPPR